MPDDEKPAATVGNTTENPAASTVQVTDTTPPAGKLPEDEELGEAGEKALVAWKERAKEAERALKEAKEKADRANLSEKEKLERERDDAQKERDAAQLEVLRVKVGAASGLPQELIDRLQGDTEEEMKDDAKRLAKALGSSQGGFGGGARGSGSSPTDMNTVIRRAAGRG